MEYLKKYIEDNQEEFNNSRPEPGHEERFLARLKNTGQQREAKRFTLVMKYYKYAATIIILLSFGAMFYVISTKHEIAQIPDHAVLAEEIQEIEQFYLASSESKLTEINQLTSGNPEAEQARNRIILQIDQIKTETESIKADLNSGIQNERMLDAVKNNYRIINGLLDHVIEQLVQQNAHQNKTPESHLKPQHHEIRFS
ncbi:MAG: hypothetical protein FD170_3122 [Bacteroidetes bacterium]|nr:MAG: hypothetical protein FD170_3122 [Bacteroidota bacterium]